MLDPGTGYNDSDPHAKLLALLQALTSSGGMGGSFSPMPPMRRQAPEKHLPILGGYQRPGVGGFHPHPMPGIGGMGGGVGGSMGGMKPPSYSPNGAFGNIDGSNPMLQALMQQLSGRGGSPGPIRY